MDPENLEAIPEAVIPAALPPARRARKPFPGLLASFGLVVLLCILQLAGSLALGVAAGLWFVVTRRGAAPASPEEFVNLIPPMVLVTPTLLSSVAVLVLGLVLAGRPIRDTLAFRSAPAAAYLAFVPMIVGSFILLSELDNWSRFYFPLPSLDGGTLKMLANDWFAGIFYMSLLGPFTEELVFRGVVLSGLRRRYRPATAILGSSILFMLMHMNPVQFPTAFLWGVMLAWMCMKTHSLWPGVFAHVLNNSLATFVHNATLPFTIQGFNSEPREDVLIPQPWWFTGLGIALFVVGFIVARTKVTPPRRLLDDWRGRKRIPARDDCIPEES